MMLPDLTSKTVDRIEGTFLATMVLSGDVQLQIETLLVMRVPSSEAVTLNPSEGQAVAALSAALLGGAVESAVAGEDGTLTMAFGSGIQLEIGPHEEYEAWNLRWPDGRAVVCVPGGGLRSWRSMAT